MEEDGGDFWREEVDQLRAEAYMGGTDKYVVYFRALITHSTGSPMDRWDTKTFRLVAIDLAKQFGQQDRYRFHIEVAE